MHERRLDNWKYGRLHKIIQKRAIKGYNGSVWLAVEVGDNDTRELLASILKEEDHIDWIEARLVQIRQVGSQNYLVEQLD